MSPAKKLESENLLCFFPSKSGSFSDEVGAVASSDQCALPPLPGRASTP